MNRYSSSVHRSDWECSSKSVRGSFFVNPLYIKNLTNLTNLTTLQTLQPYRQCVDTFLFCAACTGGGAFFRATCTGFKLEKWRFPTTEWLVPLGPEPIRDLEWKPWEPSKIKGPTEAGPFWLLRRRSAVFSRLLQAADNVPEMLHRGSDGLHSIVKLQDGSHRLARQGSVAFKVPQRQVAVLQVRQFTVKLAS